MYHDDRNLGFVHSTFIDIATGLIPGGIPGTGVSKSDAILGQHCPGPFNVESVKAALDASSAHIRNEARSIVLGNKGFSNELPRLTAQDTLILARCLVWWAHGREDCKIGGDETKPIAFLTQLMASFDAAPPAPPPVYTPPQPPTVAPIAPPAAAGIIPGISNTALLVAGGALAAGFLFAGR